MHPKQSYIIEALKKYAPGERNLEDEICECESKRLRIEYERAIEIRSNESSTILLTNNEGARMRNQNLLKDLEQTKARLRTTASFTPTDRELDDRSIIYKHSLAMKKDPTDVETRPGPPHDRKCIILTIKVECTGDGVMANGVGTISRLSSVHGPHFSWRL